LRDLRQRQKAEARISREMAGTDTKVQEAEFMDYARKSVATDEFDKLIGLADATDSGGIDVDTDRKQFDTKLPEIVSSPRVPQPRQGIDPRHLQEGAT
jgi:hypothetical protein